jgi:hypothetical protein
MFYKQKGSETYHWHIQCSKVPGNVLTNQNWRVLTGRPHGKKCEECLKKGEKNVTGVY